MRARAAPDPGTGVGGRRVSGSDEGWQSCSSPWTTPELEEGLNVVRARAIAPGGLVERVPAQAVFRVDSTAPESKLGRIKVKGNRTATATFSASEAGARFECKLDKGKWHKCASPYKTVELKRGQHTFRCAP